MAWEIASIHSTLHVYNYMCTYIFTTFLFHNSREGVLYEKQQKCQHFNGMERNEWWQIFGILSRAFFSLEKLKQNYPMKLLPLFIYLICALYPLYTPSSSSYIFHKQKLFCHFVCIIAASTFCVPAFSKGSSQQIMVE